jgi:hypothetical protein
MTMIQDSVKNRVDTIRGLSSEDILSTLGLARKRSGMEMLLPAAGVFFAGVAIGTGVALLLAPKPGRQLRRDIKNKANELTGRMGSTAGELARDVHEALTHKTEETTGASKSPDNGGRPERKPPPAHSPPAGT